MTAFLEMLAIGLCLVGAAFFAGVETGVVSINRLRLRHLVQHKVPQALILERFLKQPETLLSTTLVGTNLCHVIAATLAASFGARTAGAAGAAAAGLLLTLVLLVFSEYLPKAWFQSFPARRTLPFARALEIAAAALRPLTWAVTRAVALFLRAPQESAEGGEEPFVTREELLHLTREGERSGVLTPDESRMIHNVFELSGKTCEDVMTPRERMLCVCEDQPVEELLALSRAHGVSRFPMKRRDEEKFTGIVNVHDVLFDERPAGKTLRDYARPAQFVARHIMVDHILPRLRAARQPLALVTNERFVVIGLVTLEDVLNEVTGSR